MGSIVVQAFMSLDAVVQSPSPEEDPEGGFPHTGWATDYDTEHGGEEIGELVRQWEQRTEALLLGRRTYEIWAGAWGVWDEGAPGLQEIGRASCREREERGGEDGTVEKRAGERCV